MDSWSLAVSAAVVIGYAAVSRRLEATIVSAPIVFVTAGLVVGSEVLGWLDLGLGSEGVRVLAEATLTLVLFTDASRIDVRPLRREIGLPARLLGIGLPLTIVAGTAARRRGLRRAELGRGARARDRARTHRCRARPGGGDRSAAACPDPSGPERRERSQRRHLRAAALHRARDRRGGRRCDHGATRCGSWSRRSAAGSSAASPPACRGAASCAAPTPRRLVADDWMQVIPLAAAALSYGHRRSARRQRLHRRVRRRARLRRPAAAPDDERRHLPRRRRRPGAERGDASSSSAPSRSARRSHVVDWRIALYAVLSLTRHPHGSGRRSRFLGLGRAAADGRVRRLVRPARPRLDRLRGHRARGLRASSTSRRSPLS